MKRRDFLKSVTAAVAAGLPAPPIDHGLVAYAGWDGPNIVRVKGPGIALCEFIQYWQTCCWPTWRTDGHEFMGAWLAEAFATEEMVFSIKDLISREAMETSCRAFNVRIRTKPTLA